MKLVSKTLPGIAAFAAMVAATFSVISVSAQEPDLEIAERPDPIIIVPPDPSPCPSLRAGNITQESPHHDVKLFFPWWPGIDLSTIGDGDLVAKGPNGYEQAAHFVSIEKLDSPLPLPLSNIADGVDDVAIVPQPHPIVVATYRFFPPAREDGARVRNLWTSEDNGGYRVGLARGEIATEDGRLLPAKALGGFLCVIRNRPGVPIQPATTRCAVKSHRLTDTTDLRPNDVVKVGYHAIVQACFRTPHVEISWGDVERDGDTFKVNAKAIGYPLPHPDPIPLPIAGKLEPVAVDGVRPVDLDPDRPDLLPCFRNRWNLGTLAPGEYKFVVCVNGEVECVDKFRVPPIPPIDDEAPTAELEVRNITRAYDGPQKLLVTYRDRSGVAIDTIGDGDLVVFTPCLWLADRLTAPNPCDWEAQRARFVEIVSASSHNREVKALYEIDPPRGGWTHRHNGFYPVAIWDDAVCDRLRNCTERARIGGFKVSIDPDNPPVPAKAEVKVDPSNPHRVKAKVHIKFDDYFLVTNQSIRRDGNRIYLIAQAAPYSVPAIFPPPPFPEEELSYDIGPLREGDYAAIFVMNGHVYDAERFHVERTPPIPAKVDLSMDASDPENIFADVTIQFRTPHRVVQGEVKRHGHRVLFPAKAEPLPVIHDAGDIRRDGSLDPDRPAPVPPIPKPIHLRYKVGSLPAGGYLGAFIMNDFPYAVEEFKVDDPGPPIEAGVAMRVTQSDPNNTKVVVQIKFRHPHVIVERDIHRHGNRFILEATARPVRDALTTADAEGRVAVPVPQIVTLEYPLGDLEPGNYGAAFVMNGWNYEHVAWEESDPFEAEVSLSVEETDSGKWIATAKIQFENPNVRIVDPGEVVFRGHVLMVNAKAALVRPVDPVDPDLPVEPVAPASGPTILRYDLGDLDPGAYWLKYFINDNFEKQLDFFVPLEPPIPAKVDLKIDTSNDPTVATACVQFRNHYRIVEQATHRIGNIFILDATAEGPLPILAPIPPPEVKVEYDLGSLRKGFYIAAYRMNGHFYAAEGFWIRDPGFEAEVELSADVDDNGHTRLKAVVDIDDPYVIVTDWGRPIIGSDGSIKINARAERVHFVQEPSGDPMRHVYDLGVLRPGHYRVEFCLNNKPEAHVRFRVPPPCERPANVSHIRIGERENVWHSQVGVILARNQEVTDWGVVRRSENVFHVNVRVACVDYPTPIPLPTPIPAPTPFEPIVFDASDLPAGITLEEDGNARIGGIPVRIVTHTYLLGRLESGHYGFCVHSMGQTVACKRFEVAGDPPVVEVSTGNITAATDQHRFGITFHDPTGLDHESIRNAPVWIVSNTGYRERAELLSYASTDDVPSSGAAARYGVHGPGGSWDHEDNGKYWIVTDPTKIRDLQGNHIEHARLGAFKVRILPPPNPGVNVDVAMNANGEWEATVEIISEPGEQVVINNWEFSCIQFGQTIIKLADAEIESTNGPVEPLAHTYNLGQLQPGYYVFVFKTDLAHCGTAGFTVPGVEGDPIDNWQVRVDAAAEDDDEGDSDGDGIDLVGEYFFLLNPHKSDKPEVSGELVLCEDGRYHFGLRFRRLHGAEGVTQVIEGSRDLKTWEDVNHLIDVVEQKVDVDGTVEVLVCLRAPLEESFHHFLRVHAVRDQN